MRHAIGVDLGGTNVRAGVVREDGVVHDMAMHPVDASADGNGLVEQIVALVRPMMCGIHGEVAGVGVGLPGALFGPDRRALPGLTNLSGLLDYPFRDRLQARLDLRCRLENDANLIVIGEAAFGAARGFDNVLCLTLGTGIGGGLILDGKLREGPHGVAGEIGVVRQRFPVDSPLLVDFEAAHTYALEEVASAKAVRVNSGAEVEKVFEHAEAGYASARVVLEAVYDALAIAIVNAHLLLDLELVVLSGGMAKAGDPLCTGVQEAFDRHCPEEYRLGLRIVCGTLGDSAGILGGAHLCFEAESAPA